jgi:polyhydroxyalkanoate synthesis regulator phasin
MVDQLKKALLAGLGSAAYTYEKASKVIEEMVAKGKLTVEDGKELSQELKRNIAEKGEKIRPITKEDLSQILSDANFVTKDEFEDLKNRLAKLEEKLK